MGRPACCEKVGIKKGPWTPEEDIILVSYIQQNGPSNWRSVPNNTGLLRCSKSCRLRWTNYLRPGIKRGNFTPNEQGMIIHLQALLGNKWAAIASYLPQRTDNDIKNYWNTHLKKKLKKFQFPHYTPSTATEFLSNTIDDTTRSSLDLSSPILQVKKASYTYASSTENISRLLEGWMRSSSNTSLKGKQDDKLTQNNSFDDTTVSMSSLQGPKTEQESGDVMSREELESMLLLENLNNVGWDKSSCDSSSKGTQSQSVAYDEKGNVVSERRHRSDENNPPLTFLENWLMEESNGQVEEMMQLSPLF